MATALQHAFTVPGIVLPIQIGTRELQQTTTKFWGVRGESRISGGTAGRTIDIPVLVWGEQFNTQAKLAEWFDSLSDFEGEVATLRITSAVNRPALNDCSFDAAAMITDPRMDEAGGQGYGAFATIRFLFRQHS